MWSFKSLKSNVNLLTQGDGVGTKTTKFIINGNHKEITKHTLLVKIRCKLTGMPVNKKENRPTLNSYLTY